MDESTMRRNATQARVARVGTLDEPGRMHLVPVTFALAGQVRYSPTDAGVRQAKRLRNLTRDRRVSILIDAYHDDWATVWWVRLRGNGRFVGDGPERDHAWPPPRKKS